jgi:hypothetical protein
MSTLKQAWSNSDARSLLLGEFHSYYGNSLHTYADTEWFIWFFRNSTRHAIFHLFLLKYGNGEMVSYTDLTLTKKVGGMNLKIDSIKSTIREGIELEFITAYKSPTDKRVTLYNLNSSVVNEIADFCFIQRKNRMIETARYIAQYSTATIGKRLAKGTLKVEWIESILEFVKKMERSLKSANISNFRNISEVKKDQKELLK